MDRIFGIIFKSKITHAIRNERHSMASGSETHVSNCSRSSDVPAHPMKHRLLSSSSSKPKCLGCFLTPASHSLFGLFPPQVCWCFKRIQEAQTPPLQPLTHSRLHTFSYHDQASFLSTTISFQVHDVLLSWTYVVRVYALGTVSEMRVPDLMQS